MRGILWKGLMNLKRSGKIDKGRKDWIVKLANEVKRQLDKKEKEVENRNDWKEGWKQGFMEGFRVGFNTPKKGES